MDQLGQEAGIRSESGTAAVSAERGREKACWRRRGSSPKLALGGSTERGPGSRWAAAREESSLGAAAEPRNPFQDSGFSLLLWKPEAMRLIGPQP